MILNLELKGKKPFILSFYFRVIWSLVWSGSYCGYYSLTVPHQITVLSVLELWPSHSKCETEVTVATSLLHHQVLKTNSWMQDVLRVLWMLQAVKEWRSSYKNNCLWMALWFQNRHWRVKASFLTSPPFTVQEFTLAIQKLLLSFLGSWCAVWWWVIWEEGKRGVIALKSPVTPSAKFEICF